MERLLQRAGTASNRGAWSCSYIMGIETATEVTVGGIWPLRFTAPKSYICCWGCVIYAFSCPRCPKNCWYNLQNMKRNNSETREKNEITILNLYVFFSSHLPLCLWIQMQLWRDGKLPEVNPVFFVSLLLVFSKLGNIILWGTRWCCWDFWYGLSFFWLYWGTIDKSCVYLIYVHDVMYNVMAWHTYALWNSCHNHFTMRWFT